MRLDKLLANMGYGSRKEMKKLLKSGAVVVNGKPVKEGKAKIDPFNEEVVVNGEKIEYREFVYILMNKPQGVISATEDRQHETVIDLLPVDYSVFEPFPVGRLDKDTEGLLLLTNDGQLAHQLLSPKKHVPKTYYAEIDSNVTDLDREAFKNGVTLDDGYQTKPAELTILRSGETSAIELTITEGKFHQVKRMFQSVGKEVTYLKRISMGSLALDPTLKLGEFRELTTEELDLLQKNQLS